MRRSASSRILLPTNPRKLLESTDILFLIAKYLRPHNLCALSQINKDWNRITKRDEIWRPFLWRHFGEACFLHEHAKTKYGNKINLIRSYQLKKYKSELKDYSDRQYKLAHTHFVRFLVVRLVSLLVLSWFLLCFFIPIELGLYGHITLFSFSPLLLYTFNALTIMAKHPKETINLFNEFYIHFPNQNTLMLTMLSFSLSFYLLCFKLCFPSKSASLSFLLVSAPMIFAKALTILFPKFCSTNNTFSYFNHHKPSVTDQHDTLNSNTSSTSNAIKLYNNNLNNNHISNELVSPVPRIAWLNAFLFLFLLILKLDGWWSSIPVWWILLPSFSFDVHMLILSGASLFWFYFFLEFPIVMFKGLIIAHFDFGVHRTPFILFSPLLVSFALLFIVSISIYFLWGFFLNKKLGEPPVKPIILVDGQNSFEAVDYKDQKGIYHQTLIEISNSNIFP